MVPGRWRRILMFAIATSINRADASFETKLDASKTQLRQESFSDSSHERNMQEQDGEITNIFLIFRGEESPDDGTDPPTSAPRGEVDKREANYRSCDADGDGPVDVATIGFQFDVEYREMEEELDADVEQMMLEMLSIEIVDSLFESHCGGRRFLVGSQSSARQLTIESVSSGTKDSFLEPCDPENEGSGSCRRYDGSVVVGFNDVGFDRTQAEVGSTVLGKIFADMADDVFLDPLNLALEPSGVGVTKLRYESSDFFDVPDQQGFSGLQSFDYRAATEEGGGLTNVGKLMVSILAILFVGMLWAFFAMQRARSRRGEEENKRESATLVDEDEDDCELSVDHGDDTESYASADYNNLGRCSSKVDVQRCKKSNCSCCSSGGRLSSIDEVDMPTTFSGSSNEETTISSNSIAEGRRNNSIEEERRNSNSIEKEDETYSESIEARIPKESLDAVFCSKPPKKRRLFGLKKARSPPLMVEVIEEGNEMNELEEEQPEEEPERRLFGLGRASRNAPMGEVIEEGNEMDEMEEEPVEKPKRRLFGLGKKARNPPMEEVIEESNEMNELDEEEPDEEPEAVNFIKVNTMEGGFKDDDSDSYGNRRRVFDRSGYARDVVEL